MNVTITASVPLKLFTDLETFIESNKLTYSSRSEAIKKAVEKLIYEEKEEQKKEDNDVINFDK